MPEPVPVPVPAPLPEPLPPRPEPLPEYWCLRFGSVSGRYNGEMSDPSLGKYALDLRVDIDRRYANSPVMARVSGDIYQVFRFPRGGRIIKWLVYKESWIVDDPLVRWYRCSVVITGKVRYWKGRHLATTIRIEIPWRWFSIGPATVTFTYGAFRGSTYVCAKKSNAFRDVTLEVDVCNSVNSPPILPSYDTHAHSNRPVDLPRRTLTIEEAYQETGIALTINPTHSIIDDSTNPTWTTAELHDTMETYFSHYPGTWPKWYIWCLLASSYTSSGVAGIMFDYSVEPPDRQGVAIFRNHSWFTNLPSGAPTNDAQAAALRDFLYTYVHEIGHGFNFMHSWQKSFANPPQTDRPDALSWMNYPWRYDNLPGNNPGDFWAAFPFRFDDEELIHIRHGDRNAVIFGGQPFTQGAALSNIPELVGEAPVEFIIRSKENFHFLEPVILELKIKNTSNVPLELATELSPEFGGVMLYIERPDGRTLPYEPVLCMLGDTKVRKIEPKGRHCQNVLVNFGRQGHYFNTPGLYQIKAVYQGQGNMLIPSKIHQIRIETPLTREEDRASKDFHSRETGMALYLGGSDSSFLKTGMDNLRSIAEEFKETSAGAHISLTLATNLAQPFHVIKKNKRVVERQAAPRKAINLINQALDQHERAAETTFQNITYHQARRTKANLLAAIGQKAKAKKELKELVEYLGAHGVKRDILNEINAQRKKL